MTGYLNFFKRSSATLHFTAGEVIFRAGDPGEIMYGVQSGEAEIVVNGQVVETVGPGGIFGEMALVEQAPRSATVIAATDCVVVPVDQRYFMFLAGETPSFAVMVMSTMAQRLRHMNRLLSALSVTP